MSALYSERGGAGPTLVFWHGWGMNLRLFDPLVGVLREHFHVIAVDLPGHGRSAWQPHYAADNLLDALLDELPRGATLVGWSLGSQLALQAAQRRGADLPALVLFNPTARFLNTTGWTHGVDAAVLAEFDRQLQHNPAQLLADFLELQLRGSRPDPALMRQLRVAMLAHGTAAPAALAAGLLLLADNDLRAAVPAISQPVLIISGQHDRVTPPGAAQALAASLPNARLVEIRRAAHLPFVSHLPQSLAPMRAFLASQLGAAA